MQHATEYDSQLDTRIHCEILGAHPGSYAPRYQQDFGAAWQALKAISASALDVSSFALARGRKTFICHIQSWSENVYQGTGDTEALAICRAIDAAHKAGVL